MNHHKIKVILFGMGIMGKQITRFLADKNVPVVAAVGRRSHIGEDIGELSGIGPSGVSLLAGPDIDLEEVIKASGAMLPFTAPPIWKRSRIRSAAAWKTV